MRAPRTFAKNAFLAAACLRETLPSAKVPERAVLRPSSAISSSAKKRLQLGADIAAIPGEPPEKTMSDVVKRNVVVARHDDGRRRQLFEKGASGGELPMACALGQIPGDDDKVRLCLRYVGQQALRRGLVVPPE